MYEQSTVADLKVALHEQDTEQQLYAILLDVQTDWPEVVFVGTFDQCKDFRAKVVTPIVEANGDEAVYYETTALVSPAAAIQALRERQGEL